MTLLEGKVCLVTGAARGTGAAITRRFVEHGAVVMALDVREDDGHKTAHALGATFMPLDVTSAEQWQQVVDSVVDRHGRIDVLVNNAAVLHIGTIEHTSADDFERLLRVNTLGPFLGIKSVVPAMKSAAQGSIVNIASLDAMIGMNGLSAYVSSKWGLRGLTKSTALELGRSGIRVNTVCPAGGNPMMFRPWGAELASFADETATYIADRAFPREAELDEIADVVLFLASDLARFVTGADVPVDGGHTAGSYVDGFNRI